MFYHVQSCSIMFVPSYKIIIIIIIIIFIQILLIFFDLTRNFIAVQKLKEKIYGTEDKYHLIYVIVIPLRHGMK